MEREGCEFMNDSWRKQLDEHRGKRKEEIIAAAEAVYMEMEFSKVTIQDIVERCGISRVTLYKYFKSIDEIIFEIQIRILEQFKVAMNDHVPSTVNGLMKFQAMFDYILLHFEEHKQRNQFIAVFDTRYKDNYSTPELEQRYRSYLHQDKAPFSKWLDEGQLDGSIRQEIDVDVATAMISNVVNSTLQRMALRGELLHLDQGVDPERVIHEMAAMIIAYLQSNSRFQ
ncbi:TetR/AcrR family transcriptional regulator [Paenibacillus sp. ClWae2A]|uniref:TetR/AcrR family transcriptional regulator n=1 Tax=Paenibacillus sp. ClWae2A TaxID=3057177 RepID=UPI0028F67952|nr:TetR/AcrR family transcriptional regulator [Paenibacillus sp. ClWae2A]MDT9722855.1 TetR/AcrR family transcriptional regulator [Paenibacillus sp. ClWae2A]